MKRWSLCVLVTFCIICFGGETLAKQNGFSKRKNLHVKEMVNKTLQGKNFADKQPVHRQLSPKEQLGKFIFEDANLSKNRNQSCSSCHHESVKFADPDNVIAPIFRPVSQGSDLSLFGGRNSPTAAYGAFSPKLHWDGELFIGGMFWDGRASGQPTTATAQGPELGATAPTGDPLADQAKGPFLNHLEMALLTLEDVVLYIVHDAEYRTLFNRVFGSEIYNPNKSLNVEVAYNKAAEAIAAFERSVEVNRFSSRFDEFIREQGGDVGSFGVVLDEATGFRKYVGPPAGFKSKVFTYEEADGLALFNADSEVQMGVGTGENVGGMCYLCHITDRHNPDYGDQSTQRPNPFTSDGSYHAVLTDFSYDNLGLPKNPRIAALAGPQVTDFGLGGSERHAELLALYPQDLGSFDITGEWGKFKVSSLRNIAATAPYGHNGFFPDLHSIVHFYNTRDVQGGDFDNPAFAAEVPQTVNTDELGNLGLNFAQEVKIVKFLQTLTDK
jgi:cytochrome c peroxidase